MKEVPEETLLVIVTVLFTYVNTRFPWIQISQHLRMYLHLTTFEGIALIRY